MKNCVSANLFARTSHHCPNMGYYLHPNTVKKVPYAEMRFFFCVLFMICQLDGRLSGVGRRVGNNYLFILLYFIFAFFAKFSVTRQKPQYGESLRVTSQFCCLEFNYFLFFFGRMFDQLFLLCQIRKTE